MTVYAQGKVTSMHLRKSYEFQNFVWFGFIAALDLISYHCVSALFFLVTKIYLVIFYSAAKAIIPCTEGFLESMLCMAIDNLLIAQHGGQIIQIVTGWSSQRSHSARASEVILFLICFENQRSTISEFLKVIGLLYASCDRWPKLAWR